LRTTTGKTGWNSETEEKLRRGSICDRYDTEDSIHWNTAQAAKVKAGGANPIGFYGDVGETLESKLTAREAFGRAAT